MAQIDSAIDLIIARSRSQVDRSQDPVSPTDVQNLLEAAVGVYAAKCGPLERSSVASLILKAINRCLINRRERKVSYVGFCRDGLDCYLDSKLRIGYLSPTASQLGLRARSGRGSTFRIKLRPCLNYPGAHENPVLAAEPAGEGVVLLEKGIWGCTLPESKQESGLPVGAVGPKHADEENIRT
jgi:hypothetical protein